MIAPLTNTTPILQRNGFVELILMEVWSGFLIQNWMQMKDELPK
jgi:hypothetical protein